MLGDRVPIERLQQSTTASDALRAVRNAILDGTFPPGSQLREVQISAELGISRAPLREALHRLDQEGLVVRAPFRGAYVAEVSPEVAAEIAALRAVLEPYAVECGLPHFLTSDGLTELTEAIDKLGERSAEGDRPGSIEAHLAVHGVLYRAAGNNELYNVWKSWEARMRLFLAIDHQSYPQLSEVVEPHLSLLAVIKSGDIEQIRREVTHHIHGALPEPGPSSRLPSTPFVSAADSDSPATGLSPR
jgi:DNA-binding GntR family transcriptional regulator